MGGFITEILLSQRSTWWCVNR